MPSRFLVALPKAEVPDDQLPVPATPPPTLSSEDRNDASDEILPPTSPDKSHAAPEVEVDVDVDKENVPPSPVETGLESSLLLTAPLTCDEALSKTMATPCLAMEFEQLGVSSDDDDDEGRSDSEGEDDETSSSGEEDEQLVERPPQVLPAILGHKERLTLKRCLNGPRWGSASLSKEWNEAAAATPQGAILPLVDAGTLTVTESPRPLGLAELSAEASNAVRLVLDAADVNVVKGAPLTGLEEFPIELLPDPNWGESGVGRVG
ncbi:hypothetical protein FRC04_004348 [Tulasnella sp. 424]|nr:hypothetical protein FRC04_004348 [Tulasnella sp. 424]